MIIRFGRSTGSRKMSASASVACGSVRGLFPGLGGDQLQDALGLGSEGGMDIPGLVSERNWSWRLELDALTPELALLRAATEDAGGLPGGRPV